MSEITVLSRTQRIVVSPTRVVTIVNAGPIGPAGPSGPTGPSGPAGGISGHRFYGEGPPGTIIGAQPNDEYVDVLTGDLYVLL